MANRHLNFDQPCHRGDRLYTSESARLVHSDLRIYRISFFLLGITAVDPCYRCSNEAETANWWWFQIVNNPLVSMVGGGPRVVVSTAAFHASVRGSVPGLGGLKETKNVSSPSTCESQYCGEPPWPRGSVLGLRPPGFEFRILCLEDSVISIISPSSGGSPGPV